MQKHGVRLLHRYPFLKLGEPIQHHVDLRRERSPGRGLISIDPPEKSAIGSDVIVPRDTWRIVLQGLLDGFRITERKSRRCRDLKKALEPVLIGGERFRKCLDRDIASEF